MDADVVTSEKYSLGQYFTRSDVAALICGFCLKTPEQVVLDPACGDGVFLEQAYRRLAYLAGEDWGKPSEEQFWGVDIAEELVNQARARLQLEIGRAHV